ncbi:TetR family transcriptional regulator [Jatrophihabitans telluris]|uniref:TetR family transcriptional regulator n=1 Tax=Jatrophihabitans telluris TaxID=2038343 RepID=A0ABY4QWW2_9ACTN|nr:TetR family transcriptional regulator [Jatrophihabitans telluris]UQX87752.1 TetR family transcriptional regulator [Jatrophihabitans telluris]
MSDSAQARGAGQARGAAPSGRSRGRPRNTGSEDTRDHLINSARVLFAANGFNGTSVRAIAARAGVDASLIRHYFGDKAGLLVASMALPVNPVDLVREAFEQGPAGLGSRIIRTFLTAWDPHRSVFSALLRTSMATAEQDPPVVQMMRGVVLTGLTGVMTGEDRELRAELVVAQIVGLASLRYVLAITPLANAPVEDVAARYGPALQRLITPAAEE